MAKNELEIIGVPDWITIKGVEVLGAQRVQEAIRGALRWTGRYEDLGYPLTICPLDSTDELVLTEDLGKATVVEGAKSGLIVLDQTQLQVEDTYDTVLHAMTHASQPPNPTYLQEPLPYFAGDNFTGDNYTGHIVGYQGLRPIIRLRGEDKEWDFGYFEEGMAERNASYFPEYRWANIKYYAWGELTRANFPFDKFPNAHKLVPQNNVPYFVRTVLHVPTDIPISGNHIAKAMLLYIDAGNMVKKISNLFRA